MSRRASMTPETLPNLPTAFAAAAALAAGGRGDAAIQAFQAIIERWPDVGVAHANLAVLLRRAGRVNEAADAFRTAARLDAGDPGRHAALATACHATGRMEEAVAAMRRRVALLPGDPDAAYNLGVTLPLMGTRDDGRRWMARAVALDPSRPGAWVRLARAAAGAGAPDVATRALRRAQALSPDDPDAIADSGRFTETVAAARRWLCLAPDEEAAAASLAEAMADAGDLGGIACVLARFADREEVSERVLRVGRRAGIPWAAARRSRYERWFDAYGDDDAAALAAERAGWAGTPPIVTVIMPVCDPPPGVLEQAIASVEGQSYAGWRLRIADDASRHPGVRAALQAAAARDPRIAVVWRAERGHISAASNSALAGAEGEWVTFLDHDDLLHPHALHHVAAALVADPGLDLVYTDEDKIDEHDSHFEPHFKPDWDPDRLLAQNYVCHLAVYRRALVEAVGGLRTGYEGSQDHDLVLRIGERTSPDRIRHLPRVLYHWRAVSGSTARGIEAKPYAVAASRRAVADHLARCRPDARLVETEGKPRVVWPLPDPVPAASVIIATRDRLELLRRCVDGVLRATDYAHREVVVVDNGSERPETLAWLAAITADPRVRVLRRPGPFNFSALMNDGAAAAGGRVLVFLNNDVEPLEPGWLGELVRQAWRPEVGAVGAKLLYPDRKVQHAGVAMAGDWVARHVGVGVPDHAAGYAGRMTCVQAQSAVTGACLAMRREVFETIGGFDAERLAVDFSDIDLCLKAEALGLRVLWTPFARLLHHESASRGPYPSAAKRGRWEAEAAVMRERWGDRLHRDPWYSPSLGIHPDERTFDLAVPPRWWRR